MQEVISFELKDISSMSEPEITNHVSTLIYENMERRYGGIRGLSGNSQVTINMSAKAENDKKLYNPVSKAMIFSGLCRNCKCCITEKYCDQLYNNEYAYVQVTTEQSKKKK